ncbi:MAG: glycine-rich protein, partial [Sphingobacteriaceae bacterium]
MRKFLLFAAVFLSLKNGQAQCPTPTSVTATPSVICAGATTSLNAFAGTNSIFWYTVPTSGTPIGSSASAANFTVNPNSTITYYAESYSTAVSSSTFNYTGALQNYTVPVGVTSITVDVKGARGGNNSSYLGGFGGRVVGVLSVSPGQVLQLNVGGSGLTSITATALGGWNGGGNIVHHTGNGIAGTGGGASDIRITPYAIADRVVVAGGGGGGAYQTNGGHGGALIAQDGFPYPTFPNSGGKAGTQSIGGAAGVSGSFCTGWNSPGALFQGGTGDGDGAGGGGGGGGYYGGGGGCFGGGGGGSSFTSTLVSTVTHTQGAQNGDGQIIITANLPSCTSASRTAVTVSVNPNPTVAVNSGSICSGNSFTISPSGANTYTIQGGNTVVSPTVNSTYTVAGTSTAGCISQAVTSTVTVNAIPLPTVAVNSGSICSGSSFTMVPTGASTYTFQGGNAVVSPTANASYTVVGTNSAGCVSNTFATSSITVQALPSVSVTGAGTICIGQATVLTASGANTYSWNTGATTSSILVSPS